MLYTKKEYTFNFGNQEVTMETGRMAKQADGSILISSGGTQVLVTVVSAHEMKDGQDFFPLMVDYKEKFYAAGKFLGGFNKREGRPQNAEILLMRMIDRPLRPLFPEGYMFETIVTAQVISYEVGYDPEVLAGLGTAAAFSISDIPFQGPVGFCKVGKIDGEYVLNPTREAFETSDLELVVAASPDAILMVEGEANLISEEEMLNGIIFGQDAMADYFKTIDQMKKEVGKTKREFISAAPNETLMNKMNDYSSDIREVINVNDKLERQKTFKQVVKKIATDIDANPEAFGLEDGSEAKKHAYKGADELLYNVMRNDILKEGKRIGGRATNKVREIVTEIGPLTKAHGSSLFTRGETQVLAAVTLGSKEGEQLVDGIHGVTFSRFYLHYAFMPFSVGEARGYRGVGRREVGHGNLAERAIKKAIKDIDNYPYTIRINCEVLESNGSSSMGSVCSGSMALMDAGVEMEAPVAGVAMGLIKDGDEYQILTDILGDEDHLGDMDFKLAGTKDGITAIQMDIKITGITREIFSEALTQAREGRLHILDEMAKTIDSSRDNYKDGVPLIETMTIDKDKIGALIGPGGKNIKAVQEAYEINIEISEEGEVKLVGQNLEKIKDAMYLIDLQINGPKIGEVYEAKVVTIKEYGAFVDIAQGVSGLVHVSEIADERVNDVNDYLKEGEEIKVKVLEEDKFGKLKLSAKAVEAIACKNPNPATSRPERTERKDDRPRRPRRDDRGGRGKRDNNRSKDSAPSSDNNTLE
ncbi:polyribonucleotide nucleotidyltransferase [Bacteriovoracaceae bacterium]|nr:polyribonucleotide nucleotidyltransferase [Bacteriovoracaceae bacterium]